MKFFIPARKGSERVAGKNSRPMCGRPMISYTFDAARASCRNMKDVIVSTDDEGILWIANEYGFRSIVRPPHLCTASAKMNDVLFHHKEDFDGEDVVVLYPTNPFRTASDVSRAINAWEVMGGPGTVLMSVEEVFHRPYGLMKINEADASLYMATRSGLNYYQSQGQPPLYRANGAIYVIKNDAITLGIIDHQLFGVNTIAHVMGKTPSFEVDTEEDFAMAEAIMRGSK